jgi:hypothetical protein
MTRRRMETNATRNRRRPFGAKILIEFESAFRRGFECAHWPHLKCRTASLHQLGEILVESHQHAGDVVDDLLLLSPLLVGRLRVRVTNTGENMAQEISVKSLLLHMLFEIW